ncbi:MAG: UDP-4-amino-4,6-dideoxy-N-acetyl-beta-L-altrosamine N-acetyltransferase [Inquilinus sp.]|nr:UDP-4-amino-4,6-dideoxy-N-acetyl-beta-L-altrosamine N-acetyltransferase [Inquilinus sp.]
MIDLRALGPGDSDTVLGWRNRPEVSHHMVTDRQIGTAEHARWFARVLDDPRCTYWVVTCDGADVGLACLTGIDETHRRCSWAFYLAGADLRGRGVGSMVEYRVLSHVFDTLGLEKLYCEVLAGNAAVIAMHQRFGFVVEGHLRRHVRKTDGWHDMVQLAMLRDEWQAAKPAIEAKLAAKGLLG